MKTLFFILAIVATAGAGFFAFQTQELVKEELQFRRDQEKLLATRKDEFSDAKENSSDEKEAKLAAESDLAETISQIDTAKSDIRTANDSLTTLQGDIKDFTSKIEQKEESLAETRKLIQGMFPGEEVNFDNIEEQFDKLQEKVKELTEQRDELDLLAEKAADDLSRSLAEIERQKDKQSSYQKSLGQNSMVGTVTAVNAGWGFVVVNLGESDGLAPDRDLLVVRNGQRVGRLALASIESKQSIANIDFDSLSPGAMIRPGDRVQLAKPSRGN